MPERSEGHFIPVDKCSPRGIEELESDPIPISLLNEPIY